MRKNGKVDVQSLISAQVEVQRAVFTMNQALNRETDPVSAETYMRDHIKTAINDLKAAIGEK